MSSDSTHRELLILAGTFLFGEEWQKPLARAVAHYRVVGEGPLDPRLISRWAAGGRPVPIWMLSVLLAMVRDRSAMAPKLLESLEKALEGNAVPPKSH